MTKQQEYLKENGWRVYSKWPAKLIHFMRYKRQYLRRGKRK